MVPSNLNEVGLINIWIFTYEFKLHNFVPFNILFFLPITVNYSVALQETEEDMKQDIRIYKREEELIKKAMCFQESQTLLYSYFLTHFLWWKKIHIFLMVNQTTISRELEHF